MKKTLIAIALVAIMSSCGTSRKVVKTAEVPAIAEPEQPRENLIQAAATIAQPNVISVAEAIEIFENPERTANIMRQHDYLLKTNYEVYRLDKFPKMYYKNCRLAKLLTATQYSDYPKPMKKGVSSYVAFKDGAIIITVFNDQAYQNLLDQVVALQFNLDMAGNEDIYVKGARRIACHRAGRSVRIE